MNKISGISLFLWSTRTLFLRNMMGLTVILFFATTNIVSALTFSNIEVTAIRNNSVVIRWDTDTVATGQIEYGTTASYGDTSEEKGLSYWQQIEITGLTEGTEYHFGIRAVDYEGNETISGDSVFTTRTQAELDSIVRVARSLGDLPKVYYVKTDGNDSYSGVSIDSAWQHPSYATQIAEAGDTIYLMDGTWYDEHVMFSNSGISTHPIVFTVFNGNSIFDGVDGTGIGIYGCYYAGSFEHREHIIIKGITVRNYDEQIYVRKSNNIHIVNCTAYPNAVLSPGNPGGIGIVDNSHYCSVDSCTIIGDAWNSVQVDGRYESGGSWACIISSHILVRNCKVYDNSLHSLIDIKGIVKFLTIDSNTLGHTNFINGSLFFHQGIRHNLSITNNTFIRCKHDHGESIALSNGRNVYIGSNYFNDCMVAFRMYNDDVGLEEGEWRATNTIIYNNEINNCHDVGLWLLGQNTVAENNMISGSVVYHEYRFTEDGTIHNPKNTEFRIHSSSVTVKVVFSDNKVFDMDGNKMPYFYPLCSEYNKISDGKSTFTTYPITLTPTIESEHLTVSSVSDTSVTVESTVSTNPTTIGYTNADYANYDIILIVDDVDYDTSLANDSGTVFHNYNEDWTGGHTFTWRKYLVGISQENNDLPKIFILHQNHPNPFTKQTVINYQLPNVGTRCYVSLQIYNITGQKIKTLVNSNQNCGYYQVTWDGKNNLGKEVSSGVYYYELKTEGYKSRKKIEIIR